MRLLATGAFVRAARSARSIRVAASHRSFLTPVSVVGVRWNSSQAAARPQESFPDQSVSTRREVDPSKTSAAHDIAQENASNSEDNARSDFEKVIQAEKEEHKIVQQGKLKGVKISNQHYIFDDTTNISSSILDLVGRNLYNTPNHPIAITRSLIESVFRQQPNASFKNHIAINPVVSTRDNFDVLGFPQDHPGRSRTDTYYVNSRHVLRTHTSAHQHAAFEFMSKNSEVGYTICADVYRRDSIDRSHMPVFHQMEGARMWQLIPDNTKYETRYEGQKRRTEQMSKDLEALPKHNLEILDDAGPFNYDTNPPQPEHDEQEVELMAKHLKASLELLVDAVFTAAKQAGVGSDAEKDEPMKVRWIEAYFPFTSPSWELEVWWQGEWLELLGCGITKQRILNNAGLRDRVGWAWGIGVERLAMLLFGIPDIRLFWSTDKRFLSQFKAGQVNKFEPFSKYPACFKDVSFWINASPAAASPVGSESSASSGAAAAAGGDATKASPSETQPAAFHENDVMEIVRDVAGNMAEDVKLVDEFVHPSSGRKSLCYRINYRSLERTLTNEEVNKMHDVVTDRLKNELGVELR